MAESAGAVRTVELRASHAVMISNPAAVGVIVEAAETAALTAESAGAGRLS